MTLNTLRSFCFLISLSCAAAALGGIHAVSVRPSGTTIAHLTIPGRISAFALAVAYAAFAYGIHIRARAVWKAGFILLTLGYVYSVVGAVTATYHSARPPSISSFWLPTALVVLIGTAVTVYCGLWWKRQGSYFA